MIRYSPEILQLDQLRNLLQSEIQYQHQQPDCYDCADKPVQHAFPDKRTANEGSVAPDELHGANREPPGINRKPDRIIDQGDGDDQQQEAEARMNMLIRSMF